MRSNHLRDRHWPHQTTVAATGAFEIYSSDNQYIFEIQNALQAEDQAYQPNIIWVNRVKWRCSNFPRKKCQLHVLFASICPICCLLTRPIPDNLYYLDTKTVSSSCPQASFRFARSNRWNRARPWTLSLRPKTDLSVYLKIYELSEANRWSVSGVVLEMAFESPHQLSSFRKILEGKSNYLERFESYA